MKTLYSWKIGSLVAGTILIGFLAALPAYASSYPSLILAQSPIDYWRLNETNASPAPNSVANLGSVGAVATGYLAGGAVSGQPGIVGNAVLLINTGDVIGNCLTRVDIPNFAALNPQPPFTIEFWAKPTSLTPDGTGVCVVSSLSPFPGGGSRSGYLFYENSSFWTFRLGGENSYSATAKSVAVPTTTAWTHLVGEFDGTTATLYINGVLSGSGTASPSAPYFPNQWVPTRIGGTALPGGEYTDGNGNIQYGEGNRGYDGLFDEFAIYNTLLSSNTITAHYNTATTNPAAYDALVLASHPVGYWNMDEPAYTPPNPSTYTFADDLGSLADDGTNTVGTVADQPGVTGLSADAHSVFYNGAVGSLVLDTNVPPPDLVGSNITLAAWIKPNSFGYVSDIIAQGYSETTYQENYLRVADTYDWEGNGNPDVAYYDFGTFNGGSAYFSATYPAPPGDVGHWVFLAGTWDGANWNLYRNGALVGQYADTTGPADLTEPWSVGSRSNPNQYFGFFFDGSIEEASIFTNALGADTISNLYNSVALPPVITLAPQAPSPAYLGSSATFSVWGEGPGTLTYQWTSNSAPLVGQTATNLTLTGLTAGDDATYSVIVTSAYGAVTSAVVLVVTPTLPPVTLVPAVETRWLGSPLAFAPASLPNQQLSFQWNFDGNAIGGATNSSYTATASAGSVGSYTLVLTNNLGASTSSVAVLSTVLSPPNNYVTTILGDHPLAYFRLDETNGTVAYDFAGGNNGNYYGNVELGQPGYSLIDPDFAVTFPGTPDSYLGDIGPTSINFPGTTAEFSIEAWANGPAGQIDGAAVIAKGEGNVGATTATEQFAIGISSGVYRFFVRDSKGNGAEADATSGPDGTWHHLVGVCDGVGNNLTFYIDGLSVGTATPPAAGIRSSTAGVSIGAERSGVLPTYDWAYNGTIDEVAIYPSALSAAQVQAHYAIAYGSNLAPFITLQPVSATNYVTLPVTLKVSAAGSVPLTYQWNKVGSGPIVGATANSFTIPALALTDSGTYTVGITNSVSGILSVPVAITALEAPTNPPAIAGLVMHLTFDNTLIDATGRGNNATNEASGGATLNTNSYVPGVIGEAFSYQTALTPTTNANYASVGVRPDLQFGTDTSFTVSMWVQLPPDYVGNDLPFFCDVIGSTFGFPGYCFEPSFGQTVGATTGWPGGWGFSVFDSADAGFGAYGDKGTINDGNFHNLVYIIDRKAGATVYLDGLVAHQNNESGTTVAGIGNVNSTNSATIGQDPTGLYPQAGTANIDDLGVWKKALTPLEAASIYMAGINNQLSFVGAPIVLTPTLLTGRELELTWNAGTLQSATNLLGPWTTVTNATSPYTNTPAGTTFFRTKL